jgi:hypothetical protein
MFNQKLKFIMRKRLFFSKSIFIVAITLLVSCKKESSVLQEVPQNVNPAGFISNPKNLNIVYFIPTDNPAVADYRERLSDLLIYFQDYVKDEMNRNGFGMKSFGLPYDSVSSGVRLITINGQQSQTAYDYGSSSIILNEINAYKAAHPTEFSGDHTLIILPLRTDGGRQPFYGLGRNCFAVDNSNIKVSEIPTTTSNYIGGMLHELGHGLGLSHNMAKVSEKESLGTSLMGAGNTTFGRKPTFISEADCAILNRNQIFQSQNGGPYYEAATTTINPRVSYDASAQALHVSGRFESNRTVSDVLYWLDPNVNSEGVGTNKDYNSVAWRGSISSADSFNMVMPINELTYKENYPYELKIKLLMENGTVNTKTYTFDFVNGVPAFSTEVGFYQHSSYNGWSATLSIGAYTTTQLIAAGIPDNDLSSIKVPLGLKVVLYDGDTFTGDSYTVEPGSVSFLSNFNDKTSSLIISND